MTSLDQVIFTGSLYECLTDKAPSPCLMAPGLSTEPPDLEVPGWKHLLLRSPRPLLSHEPDIASHYDYDFLLRESRQRFLLLASHAELVHTLLNLAAQRDNVYPPFVDVPRLTHDLAKRPRNFCLGALFARVDGYGQSIRSLALYGNDLADAKLFTDLLPNLVPYRVHLRDVRTGVEIISVGSRGEISFLYRGAPSLRAVDQALSFLNRLGYLTWRLPKSQEPTPDVEQGYP